MQNFEVLQAAINAFPESLKNINPSVYGLIHNCMNTIAITEQQEEKRKEELISMLQKFWRGNQSNIGGCKRTDIQKVVSTIFGVRDDKGVIAKPHLKDFSFQELYLYYSYMERLTYAPECKELIISAKRRREKKKGEERLVCKQKAHEEYLESMDREGQLRYEIKAGKDMELYQGLEDAGEEQVLRARLLKEYWMQIGKWEGNKVSKKQIAKIEKIKKILEKSNHN